MLIILGKRSFEKQVARIAEDAERRIADELKGIKSVTDLSGKVKELRQQIETLEIEKARREEDGKRREREIEHKIGLERKRQEFELESGKKDAILKVREENLSADKKRFEEQMKFHEKRFSEEVTYLKDMVSEVLKRLPSAEFTADLTPAKRR